MMEPTVEFGYLYVEKVKSFAGVQSAVNIFQKLVNSMT